MDFNDALNRAIRYGTDSADIMLKELAKPEYNQHRWGDEYPLNGLRGVLADALQEQDRHTEAELLRTPNQHVVVDGGKVRAGRFTNANIRHHYQQLADTVADEFGLRYFDVPHPAESIGTSGYYDPIASNPEVEVGPSNLGKALSDHWRTNIDYVRRHRPDTYYDSDLFERLHNNLENAPYEEVDSDHPTENPKQSTPTQQSPHQ
jgi:hypothetical protein